MGARFAALNQSVLVSASDLRSIFPSSTVKPKFIVGLYLLAFGANRAWLVATRLARVVISDQTLTQGGVSWEFWVDLFIKPYREIFSRLFLPHSAFQISPLKDVLNGSQRLGPKLR